jgi:hypothetical protein
MIREEFEDMEASHPQRWSKLDKELEYVVRKKCPIISVDKAKEED